MKTTLLQFLLGMLFMVSAHAEFRTWTRADGKSAELELVKVNGGGKDAVAVLKTLTGMELAIPASNFAEKDAKIIADWKPAESPQPVPAEKKAAELDRFFEGKMLKLEGGRLRPGNEATRPTKCYIVVCFLSKDNNLKVMKDFQEKHTNDTNFQIVYASMSKDESKIEEIAIADGISWPILKERWTDAFFEKFMHVNDGKRMSGVHVLDTGGKILERSVSYATHLEKYIK